MHSHTGNQHGDEYLFDLDMLRRARAAQDAGKADDRSDSDGEDDIEWARLCPLAARQATS